jgi:hypothetical protein
MSATTAHHDFAPAQAEAFAGRFLTALNQGALCLMAAIGHRTGLFEVLRTLPPSTSEEIAARAGLHERYVREWLGAMATAGVVEVDPATERFALPAEHAACLTRAAAADHLAVFAQDIAGLGGVEDDLGACLQRGDGVPYEQYPHPTGPALPKQSVHRHRSLGRRPSRLPATRRQQKGCATLRSSPPICATSTQPPSLSRAISSRPSMPCMIKPNRCACSGASTARARPMACT